MKVPWTCPRCPTVTLVDLLRLEKEPINKVISACGYTCRCQYFVVLRYTSPSLQEAEIKLRRYNPRQEQYRFLLKKLLRKAVGMAERDYN